MTILNHLEDHKFSWLTTVFLFIILSIIFKIRITINQRLKRHEIFDYGNIPSIGDKKPFSGNIYNLFMKPDNMKIIEKYHRKLGKTIGAFYGPEPFALTEDLDLLQRVFIENSNIEISDLRTPFVAEFDKSLIQTRGDDWRRMRKILNPLFSHKQMKSDNVFRDIEESCEKIIKCIDDHPQTGADGVREIDIEYNINKLTMDVIFKVAFGSRNVINMKAGEKDELIEMIHWGVNNVTATSATWLSVMFNSLQRILGYLSQFTQVGKPIMHIHSILNRSIEQRRNLLIKRDNSAAGRRIMVDNLIEIMDRGEIDEETMKANLFFFLLAGFETTATTLIALFWNLARQQHNQQKLREALRNEGESAQYLSWCIQETLRLYPAAPMTNRILTEDIKTSKGQTLFKGTNLIACIYSIHHNEEYWGSDVDEFRPERFGEPFKHPMQFFAFSHGARSCIGRNLAMEEMNAIITRIILRYKLETCDSTPIELNWTSPNLIHILLEYPIFLKFVDL